MRDGWAEYRTWEKVVLAATSLPFLIAARVVWQSYPGIEWCVLFWVIALADEPLRWRFLGARRRFVYGVAFLGMLGNASATLANGGTMPVLGHTGEPSLWVPLTAQSRLVWLCDIYGGWSLGDFFILGSLLALFVVWLAEKAHVLDAESIAHGKRMPGLGIG